MTVEKLQLTLRANRLKNVAGAFKGTSDPYAVVTLLTANPGEEPVELELNRTEVVKNTLSPAWTTTFAFDYDPSETTRIRVKVFDEVTTSADIAMGVAEFDVLSILHSDGCVGSEILTNDRKDCGSIYAHVSEVPIGSAFSLILSLQARGLNRYLKKSALYLEIRRTYDGEVFDGTVGKRQWPIYRGKYTQSGSDAMCWSASIDIDALCDRDLFRGLELVLLEYDGKWSMLDTFGTTANELLSKSGGEKFVLRGEEAIIVDACHVVADIAPTIEDDNANEDSYYFYEEEEGEGSNVNDIAPQDNTDKEENKNMTHEETAAETKGRSASVDTKIQTPSTTVDRLQLTLRANRLKNVAGAFKGTSDPYTVVSLLTANPGEEPVELELGRTEVIKNSLEPAWTTSFAFDYDPSETTRIRVKVFNEVTTGADKLMGVAEFDVLRDVLYSDGCIGKVMLKNKGEESGLIYAHVSEVPIGSELNLVLSLQARGLNRYLKKSALYLEIRRTYDGEVFDGTVGKRQWPIYRGKYTQSGSDAMCWSASIDIDALCDRDSFRGLELVLLEYDGKWDVLDTFGTTVNELLSKSGVGKFVLRGEEAIIVDACHVVADIAPAIEDNSAIDKEDSFNFYEEEEEEEEEEESNGMNNSTPAQQEKESKDMNENVNTQEETDDETMSGSKDMNVDSHEESSDEEEGNEAEGNDAADDIANKTECKDTNIDDVAQAPSTTVEKLQLTLRANRLKNVAGAFKGTSDPYAVVTLLTSNPGEEPVELELDRTEVIKNSLSPAWTTSFAFDYDPNETTRIRVKVFDEVKEGSDNIMGVAEFDVLRDVLYSDGCVGSGILTCNGEESGLIYAHVSEVPIGSAFSLILSLQASGLDKKFSSKSALCLEIRRTYDGEVFDGAVGKRQWPIYRGKYTQSGSDAMCWSASIDIDALCDRDLFRGLELVLLEYDGKWREVDTFGTTANELLTKSGGGKFVLRGEEAIIVDACHVVADIAPAIEDNNANDGENKFDDKEGKETVEDHPQTISSGFLGKIPLVYKVSFFFLFWSVIWLGILEKAEGMDNVITEVPIVVAESTQDIDLIDTTVDDLVDGEVEENVKESETITTTIDDYQTDGASDPVPDDTAADVEDVPDAVVVDDVPETDPEDEDISTEDEDDENNVNDVPKPNDNIATDNDMDDHEEDINYEDEELVVHEKDNDDFDMPMGSSNEKEGSDLAKPLPKSPFDRIKSILAKAKEVPILNDFISSIKSKVMKFFKNKSV